MFNLVQGHFFEQIYKDDRPNIETLSSKRSHHPSSIQDVNKRCGRKKTQVWSFTQTFVQKWRAALPKKMPRPRPNLCFQKAISSCFSHLVMYCHTFLTKTPGLVWQHLPGGQSCRVKSPTASEKTGHISGGPLHPKFNAKYIYTWNLFVLYFGVWTLKKKAFSNQNRGHLGSRYNIYIYMCVVCVVCVCVFCCFFFGGEGVDTPNNAKYMCVVFFWFLLGEGIIMSGFPFFDLGGFWVNEMSWFVWWNWQTCQRSSGSVLHSGNLT